jgi:hypothetical protein
VRTLKPILRSWPSFSWSPRLGRLVDKPPELSISAFRSKLMTKRAADA